jgi:serine/threonine protein kinase
MEAASSTSHSTAKYEILRVVNRGGMGEIALSKVIGKNGFEKLVVLKRLREDAERDDHRAMFNTEAELMSRIEHPNIVQVFDQPVIDSVPYLAMAYVRGRNLDQLIRRMRAEAMDVPPIVALSIMGDVVRGLAFIHRLRDGEGKALGIVHQDITPSNILVSFFGEVKITDFGIAYVTSRDGGLRSGVLKGKPRYVAPEVLAGRRVNNRVDIYGVGVVLYELLKSRPLFARKKVQETLSCVAKNELPDFSVDLPNVSSGVHAILRKALSKDPKNRYRTAEDLNSAISTELALVGGPIAPNRLGNFLRDQFKGDRDAPEVDADVDLDNISMSIFPAAYKSPDLNQTLSELDKLLGGEGSSDVFALPPEIERELADITDMEPFEALTPIPEYALDPNMENQFLMGRGVDAPGQVRPREKSPALPTPMPTDLIPPIPKSRSSSEISLREITGRYGLPKPRGKSAITRGGSDIQSTDVPQPSSPQVPLPFSQRSGSSDQEAEEHISRRASVTGEYSFALPVQSTNKEKANDLEQISGFGIDSPPAAVEIDENHSLLPTPELDEDTFITSIDKSSRTGRFLFFALGICLGALLGSIIAVFFVMKILN